MKEGVEKFRRVESGAQTKKPPTLHRRLFTAVFKCMKSVGHREHREIINSLCALCLLRGYSSI
jgi:hypothetical protein